MNMCIVLVSMLPCPILLLCISSIKNGCETGRTARIGNEGLATSFYNDDDYALAPDLVKLLIESRQTIPDFLECYRPEGDVISFDDDNSDDENENPANTNGNGDTNGNGYHNGWGTSVNVE